MGIQILLQLAITVGFHCLFPNEDTVKGSGSLLGLCYVRSNVLPFTDSADMRCFNCIDDFIFKGVIVKKL